MVFECFSWKKTTSITVIVNLLQDNLLKEGSASLGRTNIFYDDKVFFQGLREKWKTRFCSTGKKKGVGGLVSPVQARKLGGAFGDMSPTQLKNSSISPIELQFFVYVTMSRAHLQIFVLYKFRFDSHPNVDHATTLGHLVIKFKPGLKFSNDFCLNLIK